MFNYRQQPLRPNRQDYVVARRLASCSDRTIFGEIDGNVHLSIVFVHMVLLSREQGSE